MPAKSRVELQKLHFVQRERFKRCSDRLDALHREIAHFLQVYSWQKLMKNGGIL